MKKFLLYSKPAIKLKNFITAFLFTNTFGNIIRKIYSEKIPFRSNKIFAPNNVITGRMVASIFFGGYESGEIRFINKYMPAQLPVLELGASIGVITTQVKKKNNSTMICIEANPVLIPVLKKNLEINNLEEVIVENYAIGTAGAKELYFIEGGENTTGYVANSTINGKGVVIKKIALSELIQKFHIQEYILVCDIEGAEISILLEDTSSLINCQHLFIELHSTSLNSIKYSVDDMCSLIESSGFKKVDSYGNNFYFSKVILE